MLRPQWEREQVFSKWIEQDARFCALNAESMEHFILLEKSGFEVKQGKHIAVKVPGMKRFKRLDTISEDFSRESLEAMFQYGEPNEITPIAHTMSLPTVRKATLMPYQKRCYTKMYRLRLADKKRFTYKSAYLYEQIRKMNELQEEYLMVVKYDVKSFVDLVHLKFRLQRVDAELEYRKPVDDMVDLADVGAIVEPGVTDISEAAESTVVDVETVCESDINVTEDFRSAGRMERF